MFQVLKKQIFSPEIWKACMIHLGRENVEHDPLSAVLFQCGLYVNMSEKQQQQTIQEHFVEHGTLLQFLLLC